MATENLSFEGQHYQCEDDPDIEASNHKHLEWHKNQPFCVALGDAQGRLIAGSRLTGDMSLYECFDMVRALKNTHPTAGAYMSTVVSERASPGAA